MNLGRILRHFGTTRRDVRRAFQQRVWDAVEQAIREAEPAHDIQLRVVVEAGLPLHALLRSQSPRQRAIELFARLHVWDTEHNSGVLIYVQFADKKIEIVADRGINAKVQQAEWDAICAHIVQAFREGRFEEGAMMGINEVGALVKSHIPAPTGSRPDELPDKPLLI